jgi:DNA ligase-1
MARSGIMLCYPFEEKRLKTWRPPYFLQPKLDGERCRYQRFEGGSFLLSSQENPFFSVPHIKKFLDSFPDVPHLDGELYCHGKSFEEIHSIVSRETNYHNCYADMEYHVFDVINSEPQYIRRIQLDQLKRLFGEGPVKVVPTFIVETLDEIMHFYDHILNAGYEGIVLREANNLYVPKRSTSLMKFKPKKQDDYMIVGYAEEVSIHGEPKGSLGALICQGDDNTRFNVGTGFTRDMRDSLWAIRESLVGKRVLVSYQHLTHGNGVPRFPVFVKIV